MVIIKNGKPVEKVRGAWDYWDEISNRWMRVC
jgi:hypothetical protein